MTRATSHQHRVSDVQSHLDDIVRLLERHQLVERLARVDHRPGHELVEDLVHRQNLAELSRKLDPLHPADVAYILEGLPLDERLLVWDLVKSERDGEILLETSDAVRESLIRTMDSDELVAAAETLDTDEIADLAADLPDEVVQEIIEAQEPEERAELQAALSYEEGTVGALMDFETVSIREDVTCEVALRYLRRFDELPSHTDALFIVDRDERLRGVLPLKTLLISDLDTEVSAIYERDVASFEPGSDAAEAAQAFERYDLVCAPVIDSQGKLLGRLTVDQVLDFIREREGEQVLAQAGLREEEDIFASVWTSFRNRWAWLAINLVTAFIASRVIGVFQGSIEKLVALAALMPIVAGIGGNSGNQTITMIVRAIAQGQISLTHAKPLLRKEVTVAFVNGLIFGGLIGLVAMWIYGDWALGAVMATAMTLNLTLAALAGVLIPLAMLRFERDPALGSSVLITALTDSGGFFIFLGLATLVLIR
jgi:magnesium transporter